MWPPVCLQESVLIKLGKKSKKNIEIGIWFSLYAGLTIGEVCALKWGNINLKKGIITGILKVSKEGMFSGANNISVYNITDSDFSSYFGFTEEEVIDTLKEYNLEDKLKDVKKWYDGYLFGRTTIFAPWSILEYLSDSEHVLKNRWTKTGNIELIRELVYENNTDMFEKFNQLLEEKKIEGVDLNLNMNLTDLESDANTIWTLLMLTGYLTPASFCPNEKNVTLRIPNHEICENLKDMRNSFFKNAFSNTNNVIKDIREERLELLEEDYQNMVIDAFSYYDTDRKEGERFYHGFTLGILYQLGNDYIVKSNRESGLGRSDIIVTKKDKSVGFIFELKEARNKEVLEKEVKTAFKQIEEKKYALELKDYKNSKNNFSNIKRMYIAQFYWDLASTLSNELSAFRFYDLQNVNYFRILDIINKIDYDECHKYYQELFGSEITDDNISIVIMK